MVVFEEIFPIHKWIIKWYLYERKEIYFLNLNHSCEKNTWIKDQINKGNLKKLHFDFKVHYFNNAYPELAFNNIEDFFRLIKENRSLGMVKKLYANDNIDLVYKKMLIRALERFYFLNYFMNSIQQKYIDRVTNFIPSNRVGLSKTDGCEIYDYFNLYKLAKLTNADLFNTSNVKFPLWTIAIAYANAIRRKINLFVKILAFLPLVYINIIRNIFNTTTVKRYYRNAIMIISPLRQFTNKIQKVDFLIDGKLIKKEDTIFLSNTRLNKRNTDYLAKNKLNYLDNVNCFISLKEIGRIFPIYLLLLMLFFRERSFVSEAGLQCIYYYIKWKSIAKKVRIDNLITYCDFGCQSIARNIILKQSNCITYFYMDSMNYGCVYSKDYHSNKYRTKTFGFLYYDYFISWHDRISEFYKDSFCKIKNYLNIGCFWAEHTRLIKEGKIESSFKKRLYKHGYQDKMKLISIFDTGLSDKYLNNYNDAIIFFKEVRKLLNNLPNIFVVLKEKHPRSSHQQKTYMCGDILEAYQRLEEHPRCYCLNHPTSFHLHNKENPSEIIAFSDLTISFSFTSPTFEAVAARKKAVWYDPANKFRSTIFDSIPGLVCHNYEELLKRTTELLNMDDVEYSRYLDANVKGRLEKYLDGKAITRFRKLVSEGKNEPEI